ncbi:phage tail tape measure protein [Alcaligenes sp. 1735tsa3]|uniref:phage tail tape measure protein n=1 Tax=Alcaligenes sp. 1735tsa3 TaxID=2953809 RepID=UPI0020A749E2|nr:phage tail tape measure protein [Alcaligenes sp. 1735tsa3]USY23945.1 phage tail tape measure protein [Alcaligenes sp. 1735tsa3]
MEGQTIATARIDIVGDASGVEAATTQAKTSIEKMSQAARVQYGQLSVVERRRIDSLLRQAETVGKNEAEMLRYNAQMRVSGPLLDEITKRIDANSSAFLRLMALNPATITASLVTAIGAAWYEGSRELSEFQTHLTMTNGAIGLSASQLSEMAYQMDSMASVTRGRAVQALTEVAKTGKIASEQIGLVGKVAIRSSDLLGRQMSDVIDEFVRLADEPTKASVKLNEQYNYLTAAVYEQIRALEQQGDRQAAAQLAQEAYAKSVNERLSEVEGTLGFVERAWNAVAMAAQNSWDIMKGIGRQTTNSDILRATEASIERYKQTLISLGLAADSTEESIKNVFLTGDQRRSAVSSIRGIQETLAKEAQVRAQVAGEDFMAYAKGENAREQKEAIAAIDRVNKLLDASAPKAEKARKAVEEYHRELDKIRAANPESDLLTPENIAKGEKWIKDKFKEPKGRTKPVTNDAATRLLMTLRGQEASLRAQVEGSAKLTDQQKRLATFEQQIADIKSKKILTADEKSILAAEDALRAQHQVNVAVEQEALARKEVLKLQERSAQVVEQMTTARDNQNEQYQRVLDSYGLGDRAMERVEAQRSIYREFERYQRQLSRGADLGLIGQERYREESDKIQAELQRRLAMEQSYYAEVDKLQSSWVLGAKQGLANYSDDAANAFKMMNSLGVSTFTSLEDAAVNSFRGIGTEVSDVVDGIIADLIRINVRQHITGPLAGAVSGALGGLFGGGSAPAGVTPGLDWTFNAKGNVYDSPSLSKFSGGIYDSPQFFAFAKGAGVFAEAGPEAIMPLKRSADGSLGVRAEMPRLPAASMSAGQEPKVVINIHNEAGGVDTSEATPGLEVFAKTMQEIARAEYRKLQVQSYRPGGLAWDQTGGGVRR